MMGHLEEVLTMIEYNIGLMKIKRTKMVES